jgi:hypothetical protein
MTKKKVGRPIAAILVALVATTLTAEASVAGGPTKADKERMQQAQRSGEIREFKCFDPNLRQPREGDLRVSPPCGPVGTKVVVSDSDVTFNFLKPGDRVLVYMVDDETGKETNLGLVTLEGKEGALKFVKEFVIPAPKTPPSSYPHNYHIMVASGGWEMGGPLFGLTK